PQALAECSRIAIDYGYDEINLNVGCPSDRVKSGSFGACLMAQPQLVADCVAAMQDAVDIPVTVKHRIGIDDRDSWDELCEFVETIAQTGCNVFIVHARKAWLQGLSPKENREIPPLSYETVHKLKQTYPHLQFIINGGFTSLESAKAQLQFVDGVMMGREVYHNPYILVDVDRLFYDDEHPVPSRHEIIEQLLAYVETELAKGTRLHAITRHVLGLFPGMPGAKAFRRYISENATRKNAGIEVLQQALAQIRTHAST
ncbi:MAG TPA: tRNA dihydrouridine(20/20a) synthase DusA, partial [Gammaproteobacteria bacterium]